MEKAELEDLVERARTRCMREHRPGKGTRVEADTNSTVTAPTMVGKTSLVQARAGEGGAPAGIRAASDVTARAARGPSVNGTNYAAKLASHIDHRLLVALAKADASSLASLTMNIAAGNWKGVATYFAKKIAPKALEAFVKTASKSGLLKALGELGGVVGKFLGPLAAVADALINADDAGSPEVTNIEDHVMPAQGESREAGHAAEHNRDAATHMGPGAQKTRALLAAIDDDKARLIADAAAAIYSNGQGFRMDLGGDATAAINSERQDEAAYEAYIAPGPNGPH